MSQYTFPINNVIHADGTSVFAHANIDINNGTFKGDTDTSSVAQGSAHGQTALDQIGSTVNDDSGVDAATSSAGVANQEAGNYSMKKVASNLATVASTILSSASADFFRNPVHDRNAVRTQRVASAIRSGSWDIFAGAFTTAPVETQDIVPFLQTNPSNADDETVVGSTYGIPGELAYRDGSALPISGEYTPKTA